MFQRKFVEFCRIPEDLNDKIINYYYYYYRVLGISLP